MASKFKLVCYLEEGTKPFKFEWYKNGHSLSADSKYMIKTYEDESELTIGKLEFGDLGKYTCTVRNHFGVDSHSTLLSVKGLPLFMQSVATLSRRRHVARSVSLVLRLSC